MAFKEIVKGLTGGGLDPDTISVQKTGVTYGNNIYQRFERNTHMEFRYDPEEEILAFKPSIDRRKGFKIGSIDTKKGKSVYTACFKLAKICPIGHYRVFKFKDGTFYAKIEK